MKDNKKQLLIFIISLIVPVIFSRTIVFLFFTQKSFIKELTNLNIHHVHYGIILVTIAIITLIFYKNNNATTSISGLGLGLILDEFIPSLLLTTSTEEAIIAYNQGLIPTLILFLLLIGLTILLYKKKNK